MIQSHHVSKDVSKISSAIYSPLNK